jgi:hypothetical protein
MANGDGTQEQGTQQQYTDDTIADTSDATELAEKLLFSDKRWSAVASRLAGQTRHNQALRTATGQSVTLSRIAAGKEHDG